MTKTYSGPKETTLSPDHDTILEAFEMWFGDVPASVNGEIDIGWMDLTGQGLRHFKRFPIEAFDEAAEFVVEINSTPGQSIYFRPAVISADAPYKVTDEHVVCQLGIWCDLDERGTADKAPKVYGDVKPNMAVITGRHPHKRAQLYWQLDEPTTDREAFRDLARSVALTLGGDTSVQNPSTLMRVPGSIAWPWKAGREIEQVELLSYPDRPRQGLERIKAAFPATAAQTKTDPSEGFAFDGGEGIDVGKAMAACLRGDHWHNNMIRIVGHLVGRGQEDAVIIAACRSLTLPGYTIDQTDAEVLKAIQGAREKLDIPNRRRTLDDTSDSTADHRPLPLIHADSMALKTEANDFVEGTLEDGAMSVIYGPSNVGKSFFAVDLACHVALGWSWREKDVEQGAVLYVAGEGSQGITNRLLAFKKRNGLVDGLPVIVIPESVSFLDQDPNVERIIEALDRAAEMAGSPVRLTIIDTLARAMGSGNENSSEDMGTLVQTADKIRQATGTHVMFIHHSGKDQAQGARGHSSLRAATDTEIELKGFDGVAAAKVTKQRELEIQADELAFMLEQIPLGENARGKPITSCVVVEAAAPAPEQRETKRNKTMGGNQIVLLKRMREMIAEEGYRDHRENIPNVPVIRWERLQAGCRGLLPCDPQREPERLRSAAQSLFNKGLIGTYGDTYWLIEQQEEGL